MAIELKETNESSDGQHESLLKITTQGRYSGKAEANLLPFRLVDNQNLVGA